MNIKHLPIALSCLAMFACNNTEFGYIPLYVPVAEQDMTSGACSYDAAGDPLLTMELDTEQASSLSMAVVVENVLDELDVSLDMTGTDVDRLKVPRQIAPLRFDYRWECESQGFLGDVGPIFLPAFSLDAQTPFCLDERDEVTGEFVGFDVVPATGGAIRPGEVGVVFFTPIPAPLGVAFREFFDVADQAEACCQEIENQGGQCADGELDGAIAQYAACGQLQTIFDSFGGQLSAETFADVQRFRPFTSFTRQAQGINRNSYPMRMSGFIEGVLPNGDLITSTQFTQQVGVCKGICGSGSPSALCYTD